MSKKELFLFLRFPESVVLCLWIPLTALVLVSVSMSARADNHSSVELAEALKSNSLKIWRDYFLAHKTAPEEKDLSALVSVTPDRLAVVPLEPVIALNAQELLISVNLPAPTTQGPGDKLLIVSYALKYGSSKWVTWGTFYIFGRPDRPPDEFGLEFKVKLYLLDASTGTLTGFPEQTSSGNTPNELNQDEAIDKLFDKLLASLEPASSKLKEMLKESRDIILRVGEALDQEGELAEDVRRQIALMEIRAEDWRLRQRGVEGLTRVLKEDDVETLMVLLDDKNSDVRANIVKQLNDRQKIKTYGVSFLPLFGKAILDKKAYVRSQAAECLGKTGLRETLGPLLASAKDEDKDVRKSVAEALGELGIADDAVIENLIEMLDDSDYDGAEEAAKSLDRFDWQPEDMVLQVKYLLSSRNKQDDLVVLGQVAVPVLIEILQSENTWQAVRAAEALGKIRDPQAVEPLMLALEDSRVELQRAAAQALGNIKDPRAVQVLMASLEKEERMAVEAAKALARIADQRAIEALATLLRKEAEPTEKAKAAAEALKQMKWHPDGSNDQVLLFLALGDSNSIAAMGQDAVDPLVQLLASTSRQTRLEVLRVLERIGKGAASAVMPIAASLKSDSSEEIIAAARALAMIGDRTACEFLMAVLQHRKEVDEICLWIRFALARIGDKQEEHLDILVSDLSSKHGDAIVEMLSMLDLNAEGVDRIGHLLASSDPVVRKRASTILGQVGHSTAVDKLWKRLSQEDNEEVRQAIREAIRQALSKAEK